MSCPICKDHGWIEVPVIDDFGPRIEPAPCPDCRPVDPLGSIGCAVLLVGFFGILLLFWWGV